MSKKPNAESACPCCSGLEYQACCGPFHEGKLPGTPEQLMRSRYSAYVKGRIAYIAETNDPETGSDFDHEAAEAWSKESEWLGLEIIAASGDEVEFKAHYRTKDLEETHHEVSLFRKDASGRWFYREGKTIRTPVKRSEAKTGRNDPCTCGSGKKFKKCCG